MRLGLVPRNVVAAVKPPRVTRYEAETLGWDKVHSFLDKITDPLY